MIYGVSAFQCKQKTETKTTSIGFLETLKKFLKCMSKNKISRIHSKAGGIIPHHINTYQKAFLIMTCGTIVSSVTNRRENLEKTHTYTLINTLYIIMILFDNVVETVINVEIIKSCPYLIPYTRSCIYEMQMG